ncbi:MAG: TraX family protein [Patescibacteria group bacterium]|nr:TraX family protein [Patescibacteria group bacterium]
MNQKLEITKNQSDLLKLIAIISMVFDHVGLVFFPSIIGFRILGRLAFPILAYQLSIGYDRTSNFNRYLNRLFFFATLSQIPYYLAFGEVELNILFTFAAALVFMRAIDKKKWTYYLLVIIVGTLLSFDYGFYGILLPAVFWVLRNSKKNALAGSSALTAVYSLITTVIYQMYALFGILLALYFRPKVNLRLSKWTFYIFYPAHLALIAIIAYYI